MSLPSFDSLAVGQRIEPLPLVLTPTIIVAAAIASRDFQAVHHDKDESNRRGMPNIIMNILTTNGFISRYVTDWAGPDVRLRSISTRLGVPNYAGDSCKLVGEIVKVGEAGRREAELQVRILNSLGEHANSTVVVAFP
jgi:acyl dehydratase